METKPLIIPLASVARSRPRAGCEGENTDTHTAAWSLVVLPTAVTRAATILAVTIRSNADVRRLGAAQRPRNR
jgi:hypothetical protein